MCKDGIDHNMEHFATVPLLIIDDLGMRKISTTGAEELLEIVMRRSERAGTLLTFNRPVEDWGKLPGDSAALSAMLDRLLHHGHVLKCGRRSWRTKTDLPEQEKLVTRPGILVPGEIRENRKRAVLTILKHSAHAAIGVSNYSVVRCIRYIAAMHHSQNDPVLKRNAGQTIAQLQSLQESLSRPMPVPANGPTRQF